MDVQFKSDKVVVCRYCNQEIQYNQRSNLSLSYHLCAFVHTVKQNQRNRVNRCSPTQGPLTAWTGRELISSGPPEL